MKELIKLTILVHAANICVQQLLIEAQMISASIQLGFATIGDIKRLKEIFEEKEKYRKLFNL